MLHCSVPPFEGNAASSRLASRLQEKGKRVEKNWMNISLVADDTSRCPLIPAAADNDPETFVRDSHFRSTSGASPLPSAAARPTNIPNTLIPAPLLPSAPAAPLQNAMRLGSHETARSAIKPRRRKTRMGPKKRLIRAVWHNP